MLSFENIYKTTFQEDILWQKLNFRGVKSEKPDIPQVGGVEVLISIWYIQYINNNIANIIRHFVFLNSNFLTLLQRWYRIIYSSHTNLNYDYLIS